jgi:hypothetical protein
MILPSPTIPKTSKNHNMFIINYLRSNFLQKKVLSNPQVFPIFILNCTAWCRGEQDSPRGALGAKQETLTKSKPNNIGGTR